MSQKIAYILEKFPCVTESFILNEIMDLQSKGIEIVILAIKRGKQVGTSLEEKKNIKNVIYLPKNFILYFLHSLTKRSGLIQNWKIIIKQSKKYSFLKPYILFKIIRNIAISDFFTKKIKYDQISHIHAHFAFVATEIAHILSLRTGIKYSFSAHAQDIYTKNNSLVANLNSASFCITCTKFNLHYINKITNNKYLDKIYCVYHGINPEKWKINKTRILAKNQILKIACMARLVPKKGIIYLLKAVHILTKKGLRIKCTIIGEGPEKQRFERYIINNDLSTKVQISDFITQDKISEVLSNTDVFILPCVIAENGDRDGLPNVIMEAMLCEVPVISTYVSAIPEIISHKETGILVDPENEHSIVDAIHLLFSDNDLRKKIIYNAKNKVINDFNSQSSVNKLKSIFSTTIQG